MSKLMSKESTGGWKLVEVVDGKDGDTAPLDATMMLVTDALLLSEGCTFITLHEQDSQVHLFFQGRWELEDCLLEGKSLRIKIAWKDVLSFVPVHPVFV